MSRKRPFLPQNMLSWAHIGLAGSFGALLVGWLVVVAQAVSRKTQIYFIFLPKMPIFLQNWGVTSAPNPLAENFFGGNNFADFWKLYGQHKGTT